MIDPIHSNIKVGTIVNIIKVNDEHLQKIREAERDYNRCRAIGDKTEIITAKIELDHQRDKYAQFLDFYI